MKSRKVKRACPDATSKIGLLPANLPLLLLFFNNVSFFHRYYVGANDHHTVRFYAIYLLSFLFPYQVICKRFLWLKIFIIKNPEKWKEILTNDPPLTIAQ